MTITIATFLASNPSAIRTDTFIPNWGSIHEVFSTFLVINCANDYQIHQKNLKYNLFFIKFAINLSVTHFFKINLFV